jgi:predicted RNA binding protein YcfA (HicA-like mRNA interferase family)
VNGWPSTRSRRVLAALLRIGWVVKRQSASHRTLARPGWADFVFAFHEDEEIAPRMLSRIAKRAPACDRKICDHPLPPNQALERTGFACRSLAALGGQLAER